VLDTDGSRFGPGHTEPVVGVAEGRFGYDDDDGDDDGDDQGQSKTGNRHAVRGTREKVSAAKNFPFIAPHNHDNGTYRARFEA
jgi:hypothetical protein